MLQLLTSAAYSFCNSFINVQQAQEELLQKLSILTVHPQTAQGEEWGNTNEEGHAGR